MDIAALVLASLFEGVALGILASCAAYFALRRVVRKLDSPQGVFMRLPGGITVFMRLTSTNNRPAETARSARLTRDAASVRYRRDAAAFRKAA